MADEKECRCAKCGAVINGGIHVHGRFFDRWGFRTGLASRHKFTDFYMCDRCYFELCESLPYAHAKEVEIA